MDPNPLHPWILLCIQSFHAKVGWIHNENSGFSLCILHRQVFHAVTHILIVRSCGWPLSRTACWALRRCWTSWTRAAGTGRTTSPTRRGWRTLSPAWPPFRTPSGSVPARYYRTRSMGTWAIVHLSGQQVNVLVSLMVMKVFFIWFLIFLYIGMSDKYLGTGTYIFV